MEQFLMWNMDVLRGIAQMRSSFMDSVFLFLTQFGEELLIIAILCFLYWCVNKRMAYGVGISYFVTAMLVQGMKITCRIERPWVLDPNFSIVEAARANAGGYSFPSGHTQAAGSLYGTLGFWSKKGWAKAIWFALALLVGFSRMYLGVHTPFDVVVSLIMTFLAGYVAVCVFRDSADSTKRDLVVLILLSVLAVGISILAFSLAGQSLVAHEVAVDYCKQAGAAVGFGVGAYFERKYIHFETKTKKWWMQLVKFIIGMVGVLAIKEGLKLVIGTGLITDTLRYFLMVLWVAALFPLLLKKCFAKWNEKV